MGKDKKRNKRKKSKRSSSNENDPQPSESTKYGPSLPQAIEKHPPKRDTWMDGDNESGFGIKTYSNRDKEAEKEKEKPQEYDYSAAGLHIMNTETKVGTSGYNIFEKQSRKHSMRSSDKDKQSDIEKMKSRIKVYNQSTTSRSRKSGSSNDSHFKTPSHSGSSGSRERSKDEKRKTSPSITRVSPMKDEPVAKAADTAGNSTGPTQDHVVITDDDLNQLSAKIVKAEIMGNQAKVTKLKKKMEEMKNTQKSQSATHSKVDETVILISNDNKGNVRPIEKEDIEKSHNRKRRKVKAMPTHDSSGARDKYFPDDDNKNLSDLVRDEKSLNKVGQDELFMKYAGKLSKMSQDRQNWTLDDMFESNIAKVKGNSDKNIDKLVTKNLEEHKRIESCHLCLEKCSKDSIIHIGKTLYIRVPPYKSLTRNHCQIVPIFHLISSVNGDEDFWEELSSVKSKLVTVFSEQDYDVVFLEMARQLDSRRHIFIDCIPVPADDGALLPAYFKKAILESDVEWSQNKKLVDTRKKSLRRSVPQGLPYFSVEFGVDGGFAHVIEEDKLFKHYFGLEIVGGFLDCDMSLWRNPQKESVDGIRYKNKMFEKLAIKF